MKFPRSFLRGYKLSINVIISPNVKFRRVRIKDSKSLLTRNSKFCNSGSYLGSTLGIFATCVWRNYRCQEMYSKSRR